jgi:hypothetical protein
VTKSEYLLLYVIFGGFPCFLTDFSKISTFEQLDLGREVPMMEVYGSYSNTHAANINVKPADTAIPE